MSYKQETIKNKALLTFEICGNSHTIESNEVECNKINLRVVKEQSCNVVFEGDKICYKITLYNDSCISIDDIDFRDRLDNDIHYEPNSFKVNGECKNPTINGRSVCYHIDELKAHEYLYITFEAEVE